ncbi:uncharacterized protein LOC132185163 [Corylus avellana]|uniref:uncharacterized protein LOC132185163 n=1 Tax=Corylus avellana TaxID=13451 RepID=UPI00286AAFCD|nr:uncharacterized protein LOC132185163 [Corylus avellana]
MGGDKLFRLFSKISRRIWLRRNGWIYDKTFSHPNQISHDAEIAVQDYEKANAVEHKKILERREQPPRWGKPTRGWMKVNVDAALNKKEGKMGFGLVMRDHEGRVVVAKSIVRLGTWDSAAAEALAAYFGGISGHEQGVQQLILEGDAKQIIEAIKDEGQNLSLLGQLIEDVRIGLNAIPMWNVEHVHREANKVAHRLAKLALTQANDIVWLEEEPPCIRDIVLTEQLLCQ